MINELLWKLVDKLKLRCRVIEVDGDPYLSRFYLLHTRRDILPGIFLHYFHRGDNDRELHNHPWEKALSFILWGGYTEEYLDRDGNKQKRILKPGNINRIAQGHFHRVELLKDGCWSLFIAGKRVQGWGFWDNEKWEYYPHTEFFARQRSSSS